MKEIIVSAKITVFESITELQVVDQDLMKHAIEARKKAYAPYSNFKVGAAILLDNGKIITGSNQENAAYPSGMCAERVAIYHAGSTYPDSIIQKIAISAASELNQTTTPIPPCGSCRQSIAEYEIRQELPIEIFYMGEKGEIHHSTSLKNLLPFMFEKKLL